LIQVETTVENCRGRSSRRKKGDPNEENEELMLRKKICKGNRFQVVCRLLLLLAWCYVYALNKFLLL